MADISKVILLDGHEYIIKDQSARDDIAAEQKARSDADTALQAAIDNKVNKETGKGLSTNDYTTAEKTKLSSIMANAEPNVQVDWNETNSQSDAFILNKPDIPNVSNLATKDELTSHTSNTTIHVTSTEKSTWNAKQNAISDLADIRSKANSAVQPAAIADMATKTELGTEETARTNADENLQSQIDAITSQSDVVDVVGTKAELNAYSKPIYVDDIVKVLVDESRSNAISYYRCNNATTAGSYGWTYIGSQGPFYTKSETDGLISGIRQVPASTAADADKTLSVDSTGTPIWKEGGSGGTTITTEDYLTQAELEQIIGSDAIWDGTVE